MCGEGWFFVDSGEMEGELFEGESKGKAVVEATSGLTATTEATRVKAASKSCLTEARGILEARPEGIGAIEILRTSRVGILGGMAAGFQERGEFVLVFLRGGSSLADNSGLLEGVDLPEEAALHRPGKDSWERGMQFLRELASFVGGESKRERDESEGVLCR